VTQYHYSINQTRHTLSAMLFSPTMC